MALSHDISTNASKFDKTPFVQVATDADENGYDLNSASSSAVGQVEELTHDEAAERAINNIDQEYTIDSDNSPFPEVRANVPNTDDSTLPVNTLRMWFLGCAFALVSSSPNAHRKSGDAS